jgi:hypothetical protein
MPTTTFDWLSVGTTANATPAVTSIPTAADAPAAHMAHEYFFIDLLLLILVHLFYHRGLRGKQSP